MKSFRSNIEVQEEIERFIAAELAGRRHPGSAVSIVEGDSVVWAKGFGYMDYRNTHPITPDSVLKCASITKPVVTTSFLQLLERGKFSLDDAINSHLDIKIKNSFGDEPTIRDLLTHYTGMPTRVPPLFLMGEKPLAMRDFIEENARMVRPRGQMWEYCNTSYMIMGYLIELFTGITYDKYTQENVLKPLEMASSHFTLVDEIKDKLVQGYQRDGGPEKPLIKTEPCKLGTMPEDSAGSLYSTVIDMGKFIIMNLNGGVYKGKRILKEETITEAHRLQASPGKSRSGMGLTWFRTMHDGHVMIFHTGGLPDYANYLAFYPEFGIGACWLSNLQDHSEWRPPTPMVLRLAVGDKAWFESTMIQKVPENWEKVVGVYGDDTRQITLRYSNGLLLMNDRLTLERIDEKRLIVHGGILDGQEMTLEYDEGGYVIQIDLANNFYKRYVPETKKVDISANLSGTWVGEYYDPYGFHNIELRIFTSKKAMVNNTLGEFIPIEEFKAQFGKVEGSCRFRIPPTYARWGTNDWAVIKIELNATGETLIGALKSTGLVMPIELKRK